MRTCEIVRGCYVARDDIASLRKRLLERSGASSPWRRRSSAAPIRRRSCSPRCRPRRRSPRRGRSSRQRVRRGRRREPVRASRPRSQSDRDAGRGDRRRPHREPALPRDHGAAQARRRAACRAAQRRNDVGLSLPASRGQERLLGERPRDPRGIAPHAGDALRRIVASSIGSTQRTDGDPAVVLTQGGAITAMTGAAAAWLERARRQQRGCRLLRALRAVQGNPEARGARAIQGRPRRLRRHASPIATRRGSLLEVHAARMRTAGGPDAAAIAITLAPAGAIDAVIVAARCARAHAGAASRRGARFQGHSTREIPSSSCASASTRCRTT